MTSKSRGTAVLARCHDNQTCEVLAGILSMGIRPHIELRCDLDRADTHEVFSEVWTKESLEKSQQLRTVETVHARLYYCVAYEFGWINGGYGNASQAAMERCAAQTTCPEVAECIKPYEQGSRSQVRPIRRPQSGEVE